jgi:TIR domain-containing protein
MSKAIGTASRKPRVFISYSGTEFDFAEQLEKALLYGGFSITAGRHKILGLDDWQQRLSQLLEASEAVVCVLAPSSATNNICRWEIEEAARLGKRTVCGSCYPLDQISLAVRARGPKLISFYADSGSPGSGFGAGGYPQLLRAAGDQQAGRNLDSERSTLRKCLVEMSRCLWTPRLAGMIGPGVAHRSYRWARLRS